MLRPVTVILIALLTLVGGIFVNAQDDLPGLDGTVCIWGCLCGHEISRYDVNGQGRAVARAPDGTVIAFGGTALSGETLFPAVETVPMPDIFLIIQSCLTSR